MNILCDIDGTLANNDHRFGLIAHKPKNWDAYFKAAAHDTVIEPVARILSALNAVGRHDITLCSGRPEHNRVITQEWLAKHSIPYLHLYMRAAGDYRPDDVVKEELLDKIIADGYPPDLVIDDRLRVVNMWKRRGLFVLAVDGGRDF